MVSGAAATGRLRRAVKVDRALFVGALKRVCGGGKEGGLVDDVGCDEWGKVGQRRQGLAVQGKGLETRV